MQLNNPAELNPWAIVQADDADQNLALWRISVPQQDNSPESAGGQLALAIFSSRGKAEEYCTSNQLLRASVVQFDEVQTLRVLLTSYQHGIRFAALDPDSSAARQLFSLRDVLKAARQNLRLGNELKFGGVDQGPDGVLGTFPPING